MTEPTGRLAELVATLDAMGPRPNLVELADALRNAKLSPADVASFVRTSDHAYNRALVALRDQYELLVMTWQPGQSSPPHDHGGSVCAMYTVQGTAVEGNYVVADDGYVDLEHDALVNRGDVTAGQDAGVHTVRNADDANENLITIHLYAPPLRDVRRFVPRPEHLDTNPLADDSQTPTVVVVGGGFSGAATAAQIVAGAHRESRPMRVILVERRGAVGEGVAYSARDANLRLNVPAAKMSLWPDVPDHFVKWAEKTHGPVRDSDFLPRQWYGEYVRETLLDVAAKARPVVDLSIVLDEVRRVSRLPEGGWVVSLGRGPSWRADAVVLAVGHRPPNDPVGAKWTGPKTRFVADPWTPMALHSIRPDEPVVAMGTGLTAVDTVLSLAARSGSATITLVSRRGLLPHPHATESVKPLDLAALVTELVATPGGPTALMLLKKVRGAIPTGADWRSVVDGLRPHTGTLWAAMSDEQKLRFCRQLRPIWEIHRHRMPPLVAEKFGKLRADGRVHVVAGRITRITGDGDRATVEIACRGGGPAKKIDAGWVLNCTGPSPSNTPGSNPAIGSLLVHGWLSVDPLGLGVRTAPAGEAVDSQSRPVKDLFVVGTLRKPAVWESTAVPELRVQAAAVAKGILTRVRSA